MNGHTWTAKLLPNSIEHVNNLRWLFSPGKAIISKPTMQCTYTDGDVVVLRQESDYRGVLKSRPVVRCYYCLFFTETQQH